MSNPNTHAMTEPELWGYHEEGRGEQWARGRDWCLAYMQAHEEIPLFVIRQDLRERGFITSEVQAAFVLYADT